MERICRFVREEGPSVATIFVFRYLRIRLPVITRYKITLGDISMPLS